MKKIKKIFISYSHADFKKNGHSLYAYLEQTYNDEVEIFIDQKLILGDNLDVEIKNHLRESDILILILTSSSMISNAVIDEIAMALKHKKRIICCKDELIDVEWMTLPETLRNYVGIEFQLLEDLKRQLVSEINKITGKVKSNEIIDVFNKKLNKSLKKLSECEEMEIDEND